MIDLLHNVVFFIYFVYQDCNDGDVMLVGGSNSYEGTIEICFDNLWGLISHTGWSDKDAAVACSQLGLATNSESNFRILENMKLLIFFIIV